MKFTEKCNLLKGNREKFTLGGRSPFDTVIEEYITPSIVKVDGKPLIMLASSNYLSMSLEPSSVKEASVALAKFGTGTVSTRPSAGTFFFHKEAENELADFFNKEHSIIFSSGPLVHFSALSALAGDNCRILIDEDCHAALFSACKLSSAAVTILPHNNLKALEKKLKNRSKYLETIVVVDGVYSMLGDKAPLAELAQLKAGSNFYLYVNESHSLGVLGPTGAGAAEDAGIDSLCDFIAGSFAKAAASTGGFIATSNKDAAQLVRFSDIYNYSTGISPASAAAAMHALSSLQKRRLHKSKLWDNMRHFYEEIVHAGFETLPLSSPIIPVFTGNDIKTLHFWRKLIDEGVFTNPAFYEDKKKKSFIRVSLQSALTDEEIDRALAAFFNAGKEFDLI